jgi:hypothetical protein
MSRKANYNYRTVYQPSHPKADLMGYVAEHILIAEDMLGRSLKDGEVVHHRDFHRPNNSRENLRVITRKEHQQLPAYQARYLVETGQFEEFWTWYQENKDKSDPQRELEIRILHLEEKQKRTQRKLDRETK